jgi:hypothetical protein
LASVVTITQVSSGSPLPEARDREQRLAARPNEERLLLARGVDAPFVKSARGNQAAAARERLAKRWLGGEAVEPCVDQPPTDTRVLRPERHEPPAECTELALAVAVDAHGRDVLTRREVVVRREHRRLGEREVLSDQLGRREQRESPAHFLRP